MKYLVFILFSMQLIHAQKDTITDPKSKHDAYVKQLAKDDKTKIRNYMRLADYRKIYKNKGIKISMDTVGYMISRKDTLLCLMDSDSVNKIKVARPFEYKDSSFVALYKKVAFNDNFKDNKTNAISLKYWKREIKIYFTNSIPKKSKKSLISFISLVSKGIDSLKISVVKNIDDSNYVVYSSTEFNYCQGLSSNNSDYYINWTKNRITNGYIKMNSDQYFNEKEYNIKLNEYFLQSLGFFKLTDFLDCDNYFSNCFSDNKRFSEIDKAILKYHYSYGICKGITEENFDSLHKTANEIRKNNKLDSFQIVHEVTRKTK